jgi:tetratricopeptide (TPR) repeat protein
MSSITRRSRKRLLAWGGAALALIAALAASAAAYYRQARTDWLAQAEPEALLAAARQYPDDAEVLYTAALRLWEKEGRLAEAAPLARRAAALAPDRALHHQLVGLLSVSDRRPAEGLLAFERAVELEPQLRTAHVSAGQIYLQLKMPDEALRHLEQAWNPSRPEVSARIGMIEALRLKGELELAESMSRQAMQFAPFTAVEGYRQLCSILKARGRWDAAEDLLKNHLKRYYGGAGGEFFSEWAEVILERPDGERRLYQAEQLARTGLEKAPETPRCRQVLGAVLLRRGRPGDALPLLEEAARADPKSGKSRALLAKALRAVGREAEARRYDPPRAGSAEKARAETLRKEAGQQPDDLRVHLALAEALANAGEPGEGFRALWPALRGQSRPDEEALKVANRVLHTALSAPQEER